MNRIRHILRIHQLVHALGVYDGNIVGMAGEIIAEQEFGMIKARRQNPGFDGQAMFEHSLQTIEVKSLSTTRLRARRHKTTFKVCKEPVPAVLLVLAIFERQPRYEILYHGYTSKGGNPLRTTKVLAVPFEWTNSLLVERMCLRRFFGGVIATQSP